MAENLVIVESPAKVKTIKKFLGKNYEVLASQGHVRDMPKSQLGIGPENDYEPKYITIRGKGPILADLRKSAKKADKIYLATDPDREGEAIAWHLANSLNLEGKKVYRITFNEITKSAVQASFKNARQLDMNLVDAQQARRSLDRIVGYKISPLLWEKVKSGLSAGRVQSAALHMICDRENEIEEFIPEEYWSIDGMFAYEGQKKEYTAKLAMIDQQKAEIHSAKEADAYVKDILQSEFQIKDIVHKKRVKMPPLPFTTSTLQQEAADRLNFTTQKTMRIAQQLYEGVEIKGQGTVGMITYLRTDSTRVSEEAQSAVHEFIKENYGTKYLGNQSAERKDSKNIQDAHEAIRPADVEKTPAEVKDYLSRDQYRLYQLIWNRFVGSRMEKAEYRMDTVKIDSERYEFSMTASTLVFPGFLNVYTQEDGEKRRIFPEDMQAGQKIVMTQIIPEQHFTQAPAHYTEASLVKALEEEGIGRPSTYAPIITTLMKRHYITKEDKKLYITEIGKIVDSIMDQAFPAIVNTKFTANVESLLDAIADGKVEWKTIIRNFYPDIEEEVEKAQQEIGKVKLQDELTDEKCEKCGRPLAIKYGPYGKFLACSGFPECRNTKEYQEETGVKCPACGGNLVVKTTRKGRRFYGCNQYPKCEFMSWQKPVNEKCPQCGSYMTVKGKYVVCSGQNCTFRKELEKDE